MFQTHQIVQIRLKKIVITLKQAIWQVVAEVQNLVEQKQQPSLAVENLLLKQKVARVCLMLIQNLVVQKQAAQRIQVDKHKQ